jgi:pyruvate dehydrogenase E2 component (dihydrolipoamide acetyltransferase)
VTINILMPALSPTMEEGTLAKWLVKEGDKVASGSAIAEIETDKATMEFEAADDGVVGRIVVPEGTEGVKVNELIAVLLEEGEDESALETGAAPEAKAPAPPQPAEPRREAPSRAAAAPTAEPSGGRVFASPLARRIAAERGLDLSAIRGSGPNGRIVKADVLAAERRPAPPAEAAPQPAAAADADAVRRLYADRPFEEVALDGMRRTIAARLTEAKQTIPHFYLRRDVRLDALLALRTELNRQLEARGVKLSVNDFVIKASALALQAVPDCNAVWAGDRILRLKPSDVAVAVAIEGGLFTPVIRDAERKSLSALSSEMKDLATRAKERKLAPHEYQGGSFAISNLGMMGIESFDAVINPPQASILAVGAGVRRPVVDANGEIAVATVMSLTLSVDHRVIDGALGASFLDAILRNLENPLAMLA